SNLMQAAVAAAIIRLADHAGFDLGNAGYFLCWYLFVNVLLASFNMIPIPPLDGHKILVGILPNFWYPVLAPLERYGFAIIFVLFFATSWLRLPSITTEMISPIRTLLLRVLL
ncbi:MAG: site-2 protease family protein, partial [Thermomicrobiales bacterium]